MGSSRRMGWLGSHSCVGEGHERGLLAQPVQVHGLRVVNHRQQFPQGGRPADRAQGLLSPSTVWPEVSSCPSRVPALPSDGQEEGPRTQKARGMCGGQVRPWRAAQLTLGFSLQQFKWAPCQALYKALCLLHGCTVEGAE